ncbi:hypothetical protein SV7mr_01760 [Stieleria bergensis]|uniref:Uncharacterized protein n=1 Tax=Stieleria bergensis TaxID=2528025 RepID=A0A517SNJ5_9BACT|nr:hypothetical protein SV7mr_01760 [Planctomycetes bacterium SV_7m_r]
MDTGIHCFEDLRVREGIASRIGACKHAPDENNPSCKARGLPWLIWLAPRLLQRLLHDFEKFVGLKWLAQNGASLGQTAALL